MNIRLLLGCLISTFSLNLIGQGCPQVQPFPYYENFDGPQFTAGSSQYGPGTLDSCWIRQTGDYFWRIHEGQMSHSANTGAAYDHTTGNGNYAYTELSNSSTGGMTTYLITPWVNLDTANAPLLTYFVHRYGSSINYLNVHISNGGTWIQVDQITGANQTSMNSPWEKRVVNLSNYAGDTVRLKFTGSRSPGNYATQWEVDLSLDDISITSSPICSQPQNLINSYLGATKASFNWVSGGASNYQVLYGLSGFNLNNGTSLNSIDTSVVIKNLLPQTSYDLYVRDSCGLNQVSAWVGPISFTTKCLPAITPYTESFDGSNWVPGNVGINAGNQIPQCWSRPTGYSHFGPLSGPTYTANTGPQTDVSGNGKYIYTDASAGTSLTPPQITSEDIYIASGSLNPELKFYYFMYGIGVGSLNIEIGKNGNFNSIKTISGQQQSSSTDNWKADSVSLNSYIGDTIQIRIIGNYTSSYGDIAVDELSITANCKAVIAAFTDSTNLLAVDLFSSNTTGADSLLWNFGDSTYSTLPNPSHTYDSAGTYVVSLIASNDCGNSDTIIKTISVCDSLIPKISLSQNEDTIFFDATGSVGASNYYWDFGDGTDTSGIYIAHQYNFSGNKTIRLLVVNSCGDTAVLQNNILVCWPPKAKWNYTLLGTTAAGMKVQFDGTPSKNATSYYWDFGDGSTDSTTLTPTHTYISPGLHYQVSLQVKNDCNQSSTMSIKLSEINLDELSNETYVAVYPNPTIDKLIIDWSRNDIDIPSIEIYTINGRNVLEEKLQPTNERKAEIDVSYLPSGTFILKIKTHSTVIYKQLIVQ